MKFKNYFLFLFIGSVFTVWTQTPIEAQNLLELASKQMESYKNIEFEFSYTLNNRMEQINQESSGKVTIAEDKYKLKFQTLFFKSLNQLLGNVIKINKCLV